MKLNKKEKIQITGSWFTFSFSFFNYILFISLLSCVDICYCCRDLLGKMYQSWSCHQKMYHPESACKLVNGSSAAATSAAEKMREWEESEKEREKIKWEKVIEKGPLCSLSSAVEDKIKIKIFTLSLVQSILFVTSFVSNLFIFSVENVCW